MSQPRELAPFQVTRSIIASAAEKVDESAATPILPLMLIGPTTPDAFKGLPHMRDLAPVPSLPEETALAPSDEAVEDDPKADADSSATNNASSSETAVAIHPSSLLASQVANASAEKDENRKLPPLP